MISDALSLIRTDLLKLCRRRGLIALTSALAVGGVAVIFAVLAIRHGSNPLQNSPAGGNKHFENATDFVAFIGVVVAALVGATAGASDDETGVLRDLVATGRSRAALFASRALAAIGLTLALLGAGLALATICSVALAGSAPTPTLAHIVQRDGAALAFGATSALVAVGIATFARTRGPVIAVVLGFGLVVSQLLLHISFLGDLRALLPLAAFERAAGDEMPGLHPSLASAGVVMAGWAMLSVAAGAWWARRVEI